MVPTGEGSFLQSHKSRKTAAVAAGFAVLALGFYLTASGRLPLQAFHRSAATVSNALTETYTDPNWGFSLDYPADLRVLPVAVFLDEGLIHPVNVTSLLARGMMATCILL